MMEMLAKRIEDKSMLACMLNECLHNVDTIRIFSTPTTFKRNRDTGSTNNAYCICLLFEEYAKQIVVRLRGIISAITEYETGFNSSWKYYAMSKRLEAINQYGGEEDDYDENGDVIKIGLTDEQLFCYSIISDLYLDDWKDLAQETTPNDLSIVASVLNTSASITITDMFKQVCGKTILPTKINNNGEIVKMTREDVELDKITKQVDASDLSEILFLVCGLVQYVFHKIKTLPKDSDNKEDLKAIKEMCQAILNLEIDSHFFTNNEFITFYDNIKHLDNDNEK